MKLCDGRRSLGISITNFHAIKIKWIFLNSVVCQLLTRWELIIRKSMFVKSIQFLSSKNFVEIHFLNFIESTESIERQWTIFIYYRFYAMKLNQVNVCTIFARMFWGWIDKRKSIMLQVWCDGLIEQKALNVSLFCN